MTKAVEKMKSDGHSPLPWIVRMRPGQPKGGTDCIVQAPRLKPTHPYDIEVLSEDTGDDMYPSKMRLADAHFIVEACNNYSAARSREQALREELEQARHDWALTLEGHKADLSAALSRVDRLEKALGRASKVAHCMEGMHFENGDVMSPEAQLSVASALAAEIDEALAALSPAPQPNKEK